VLGGGTPFFPALDDPIKLRLVETHTFGSGVVYLSYQRADAGSSGSPGNPARACGTIHGPRRCQEPGTRR